jgi:hypothetical protein
MVAHAPREAGIQFRAMEPKRRRPIGIWMIVILELVNGLLWWTDIVMGATLSDMRLRDAVGDGNVVRGTVLFWSSLVILAAVLLWRLDRRGWVLMMVLVGVSMFSNLAVWWQTPEQANWLSMAVSILTVFYLNSASVRTLFLRKHEVPKIQLSERGRR